MAKNRTLISALAATTTCIALTACGGGSDETSTSATGESTAATDELGGAGQWTNEQLCALSTPEAVSQAFGVDVDEQPARGDNDWSTCFWKLADDPLAQAPMSISDYSGFTSDGLGGDEQLDIDGADMAAYSENIGGAANVSAVVGEQRLEITFPVGTEGARDFGTAIVSIWAANQS